MSTPMIVGGASASPTSVSHVDLIKAAMRLVMTVPGDATGTQTELDYRAVEIRDQVYSLPYDELRVLREKLGSQFLAKAEVSQEFDLEIPLKIVGILLGNHQVVLMRNIFTMYRRMYGEKALAINFRHENNGKAPVGALSNYRWIFSTFYREYADDPAYRKLIKETGRLLERTYSKEQSFERERVTSQIRAIESDEALEALMRDVEAINGDGKVKTLTMDSRNYSAELQELLSVASTVQVYEAEQYLDEVMFLHFCVNQSELSEVAEPANPDVRRQALELAAKFVIDGGDDVRLKLDEINQLAGGQLWPVKEVK